MSESEDPPAVDDLRVHAVALLAGGHATAHATGTGDAEDLDLASVDLRDLLPVTTLVVHLYGGTHTGTARASAAGRDLDADGNELDRIARIEGHGVVTESWLREVLGRFSRFEVLPVLDIDGLAPVDSYEIPARHRRAVQLRHPVETFPWGSATSTRSHTQIDHLSPYDHGPGAPPGQTHLDNLTPLATHHHRLKTHGGWQVRQPFPGITLWRDPHGHTYLLDPTGTRALGTDKAEAAADPPTRQPRPVVVELHHSTRPLLLADDFAA